MKIPFAKVDCSGNELKYLAEVIQSGWLTTASKCAEFEKRFAEAVGGKYACAVNSCTAALHLAAEAIGIGPGDKVFVPTMTFTASAEVIRYLGADPVFLDVEYGTCLVTPEILLEAIARHPDAKALILVHFGGQAAFSVGSGQLAVGSGSGSQQSAVPVGSQQSAVGSRVEKLRDRPIICWAEVGGRRSEVGCRRTEGRGRREQSKKQRKE